MRGGTVCDTHGGKAPQVKAAAERRLADLRPAAINYLDWLINQKDYPSAGLGAAKDVLDRNDGKPHESLSVETNQTVNVIVVLQQRHARRRELAETGQEVGIVHQAETNAGAR